MFKTITKEQIVKIISRLLFVPSFEYLSLSWFLHRSSLTGASQVAIKPAVHYLNHTQHHATSTNKKKIPVILVDLLHLVSKANNFDYRQVFPFWNVLLPVILPAYKIRLNTDELMQTFRMITNQLYPTANPELIWIMSILDYLQKNLEKKRRKLIRSKTKLRLDFSTNIIFLLAIPHPESPFSTSVKYMDLLEIFRSPKTYQPKQKYQNYWI